MKTHNRGCDSLEAQERRGKLELSDLEPKHLVRGGFVDGSSVAWNRNTE